MKLKLKKSVKKVLVVMGIYLAGILCVLMMAERVEKLEEIEQRKMEMETASYYKNN